TRGLPCDASCPYSVCAPESPSPDESCAPQHLGPGDACVADLNTCNYSYCVTDGDCTWGKVCIQLVVFLGCGSACCAPCPPYPCLTSEAPTCGGACPAGQVCGQMSGGTTCGCVRSDQTWVISGADRKGVV